MYNSFNSRCGSNFFKEFPQKMHCSIFLLFAVWGWFLPLQSDLGREEHLLAGRKFILTVDYILRISDQIIPAILLIF
jgi:hypothetical protein